jgi:hypothetical protein
MLPAPGHPCNLPNMRNLTILAAALFLTACATPPNIMAPSAYKNTPAKFAYCTAFGCGTMIWATFTDAEWAQVAAQFDGVNDAASERAAIAKAVSVHERIVGPKGGTQNDEGGTGLAGEKPGQLDCFAEAANTTVALQMMQNAGLIRFHRVTEVTMRGVPYGTVGFVHATATIQDIADGRLWVVDSWYFPNGGPSFVVDRDEWRAGWAAEGGAGF